MSWWILILPLVGSQDDSQPWQCHPMVAENCTWFLCRHSFLPYNKPITLPSWCGIVQLGSSPPVRMNSASAQWISWRMLCHCRTTVHPLRLWPTDGNKYQWTSDLDDNPRICDTTICVYTFMFCGTKCQKGLYVHEINKLS